MPGIEPWPNLGCCCCRQQTYGSWLPTLEITQLREAVDALRSEIVTLRESLSEARGSAPSRDPVSPPVNIGAKHE